MIAAHGGGHGRGLPWLAPIWNSSESRGLCCRSCFGPRTCGRSITISSKLFGALNQGFPFSLLQCRQGRTRMVGWEAQRKCVSCMQGVCGGFGTRRPSSQEAFCKRPRGGRSAFYYQGFICQLTLYISFCRGMMRFFASYA